jgi:hypothetical protein
VQTSVKQLVFLTIKKSLKPFGIKQIDQIVASQMLVFNSCIKQTKSLDIFNQNVYNGKQEIK